MVSVFFIWTRRKEKLRLFLEDLNKCHLNNKFTHETNKKDIIFLDVNVQLLDGKISTDLLLNLQIVINISITHLRIQNTAGIQQF